MKKLIKTIAYYIAHKDEINNYYEYAVKEGYQNDETLNWYERTHYYLWGMANEGNKN
jgi:hypothetical protein